MLSSDHPRSRGEHDERGDRTPHGLGSSPLTRGARWGVLADGVAPRDHPRSRGEHLRMMSSHTDLTWIIPAHAGSTGLARKSWTGN